MIYFKLSEFACHETGENGMQSEFLADLDLLREDCGFPFVITSGFRSVNHSIEKTKDKPGLHTKGIAADIACSGSWERYRLIQKAIEHGFNGIGIGADFIHVDKRRSTPVMWVY